MMRRLLVFLSLCAFSYAAAPEIEQLKSRFVASNATDYGYSYGTAPAIPDVALGQFSILSNGWPGQLTLSRDGGSGFKGTIQYHNAQVGPGTTLLGVETLQQIQFTNDYGGLYVTFYRPGSSQQYFGLFDQTYENINGHFTSGGLPYSFDATRGGPVRYVGGVDDALLGGSWSITSNGWPGALSFTSATTGTIQYDNIQSPYGVAGNQEAVNNLFFAYLFNTWYVHFYRPQAAQWYWGIVEKNLQQIHGHFLSGGAPYEFDAVRASPLPPTNACPVPAFFAGEWAILSNGWPGQLSLPGDIVFGKPTIQYDNTPLPGGTSLAVEPITGLLALRKYDGWYLHFYRVQAAQFYFAIFDTTTQSLHGHFTDSGKVYEFTAQKVPAPAPLPPHPDY